MICFPLDKSRILQAYPLAQAILPDLSLARWAKLAEPLTAPETLDRQGIMIAVNPAGYIYGLCFYRIEEEDGGRRLTADRFVAFDLLGPPRAFEALLSGLDDLAQRLGCFAVHTFLKTPQESHIEGSRRAGHDPKLLIACKRLERVHTEACCRDGRIIDAAASSDAPQRRAQP